MCFHGAEYKWLLSGFKSFFLLSIRAVTTSYYQFVWLEFKKKNQNVIRKSELAADVADLTAFHYSIASIYRRPHFRALDQTRRLIKEDWDGEICNHPGISGRDVLIWLEEARQLCREQGIDCAWRKQPCFSVKHSCTFQLEHAGHNRSGI